MSLTKVPDAVLAHTLSFTSLQTICQLAKVRKWLAAVSEIDRQPKKSSGGGNSILRPGGNAVSEHCEQFPNITHACKSRYGDLRRVVTPERDENLSSETLSRNISGKGFE